MKSLKYKIFSELRNFTKRKANNKAELAIVNECKELKNKLVKQGKQDEAKEIWVLENTYVAQNMYIKFTKLIRKEKFYEAWCLLEQCEIKILNLKKHFPPDLSKETYFDFLCHQVPMWQKIFPYRIFNSTEFIERKIKCSSCGQIITARNFCGHQIGEIYDGEMCYRIIEDFEIVGFALVKNPVNKMNVIFESDGSGKRVDHYDYKCIRMISNVFPSYFYWWEINKTFDWHDRSAFSDTLPNDLCPCGSERTFSICCASKSIVTTPHIEIIPLRKC